jgi:hypothetical protein
MKVATQNNGDFVGVILLYMNSHLNRRAVKMKNVSRNRAVQLKGFLGCNVVI